MNAEFQAKVANICKPLPGAEVSDPWGGGHDAWKVGDKMFASIGVKIPGVAVKTADVETATMLIDTNIAIKAPYFHRSWVLLPETTDAEELNHRIVASYDLIRAKLHAKVRGALSPREGA